MESSKLQDAVFQYLQHMEKLECALKVSRDKKTLLRAENTTSRDKVTDPETKQAGTLKNPSNS